MIRKNRRDGPVAVPRLVSALALALFLVIAGGGRSVQAQEFSIGDAVIVDTYSLHFHVSPTQSSDVQFVLEDGTWATIIDGPVEADGYVWYQLDVDGAAGWSVADYLVSAVSEHSLLPVGSIAVVTGDSLNVRADPSLAADVTTVLTYGDTGVVLSGPVTIDGYDWYELDAGPVSGWSVRDYLAFARIDPDEVAIGDTLTINTDFLRLRNDATLDGAIVEVVSGGTIATVLDGPVESDGYVWFQVTTEFGTGWVCGEYFYYA